MWYCFFPLLIFQSEFFFQMQLYFVLFYCLLFAVLVKVTDQNFHVYCKRRINIRAIQIIFCDYVCEDYNSNVTFNLYLFKRTIIDVV